MKKKFVILIILIIGIGGFLVIFNSSDRMYSRSLIQAIEESNHSKLEDLLEEKGNVNAVPYSKIHSLFIEVFNDPPLFYAIRKGDIVSVKLLLEHGANANGVSDFYTALKVAGQSKNVERFDIANLLLDYNADINYIDKWGESPFLYFAIGYNNNDDYDKGYALFLRFHSMNAIPNSTQEFTYGNFLLYAVTTNNVLIVDYLINTLNYDINAFGKDGVSALIRATQYNAVLVVEYLVQNGVDVSYRDSFNKTAYDYAFEKNYTDILNLLSGD